MEKRWLIVKQQKKVCISKKWVISISASLLRQKNETAFGNFKHQDVCLNQGAPHKLSPWLHLPPFFFLAPALPPLFLPNTMRQDPPGCYDFSPVSVWNAPTDCLDSRTGQRYVPVQREAAVGHGGTRHPDTTLGEQPGPRQLERDVFKSDWSSTRDSRWGSNGAVLKLSLSLSGLICASLSPDGVDVFVPQGERRLEVERAQQLAPEWAAIHESNWRIRMVFVTFDMPLASMVSTVNVVGNCW